MSKKVSLSYQYPVAPAEIHKLLCDPGFIEDRARAGAVDAAMPEHEVSGDGAVRYTVHQTIPATGLPAVARSVIKSDPVTERSEAWVPDGDGYRADVALLIKVGVGTAKGVARAVPAPGGTRVTIDLEVDVPVPVLGGKLESVVIDQVTAVLGAEDGFIQGQLER
ncbi:MAG TPA: DUF2505 domain-containing protein [Rugosimonospora sp.]|nr:DUF2505 domain-containing protein [Rugosimonospora sp.]